jgi:hypothetical protein
MRRRPHNDFGALPLPMWERAIVVLSRIFSWYQLIKQRRAATLNSGLHIGSTRASSANCAQARRPPHSEPEDPPPSSKRRPRVKSPARVDSHNARLWNGKGQSKLAVSPPVQTDDWRCGGAWRPCPKRCGRRLGRRNSLAEIALEARIQQNFSVGTFAHPWPVVLGGKA